MKRSAVGLTEIANLHNLATAFYLAARRKRGQPAVAAFQASLDREIASLRAEILAETWQPAPMRRFRIRDPKPRLIHAPAFRDRVLHHAIMAHVGPVLDRTLVFDTYACRTGKGTIAAVQRARAHAGRFAWFGQIDVQSYFASIDHALLLEQLGRRFKDAALLRLLAQIVAAHASAPGKGLPIGTLTSQHFANFYLAPADRLLLEVCGVGGYVRYMDDLVWWTHDRASAWAAFDTLQDFLGSALRLTVKLPVRIGRCRDGLSFLGFRVRPDRLLLSRRRRRRYAALRGSAEALYLDGLIDALGLQAAYSSALALTVHADAAGWRREQLRRVPVAPALVDV